MRSLIRTTAALCCWALPLVAAAQGEMPDVEIEARHVGGHVHALYGQGGNIGVSAGEDGVFLIDDQFAPLTDRILAALAEISDEPVRFVINTHWHGDHVGGNENLAGAGAVIVAHDNVRQRMSTEQFMEAFDRTVPASPPDALPVVTFNDTVTFHLNDDTITVTHVPAAHTDGDSIIHFENADVLHTGDVFFSSGYPFIDLGSGGSVQGMIAAVEQALSLAGEETRVIPGHGPLSDRAGLAAYHRMLNTITERVSQRMEAGESLEAIREAGVTAEFDERWDGAFIDADRFVGFVHRSLQR